MKELKLHQEIIFKGVKNTVTTINGDGTIRLTEYDSGREHGCYYPSELNSEDNFKGSPMHDKQAIINILDKLTPEQMIRVVDFIRNI